MKKGQTLTNFALTMGLIIVIGVVIIVLKQFLFSQARLAEAELADHLVTQITSAISKAVSYPSDAKYVISVPYSEKYTITVTEYMITLYFPNRDLTIERELNTPSELTILDSIISDSGTIFIYKSSKNIYITSEDFDISLEDYLVQKAQEAAPVEVN